MSREALPARAATPPTEAIIAFCARLLPDVERLEAMAAREKRRGGRAGLLDQKELFDASQDDAHVLAGMRPVTLPGFIAKARIARYHLFLGIAIASDLEALSAGTHDAGS